LILIWPWRCHLKSSDCAQWIYHFKPYNFCLKHFSQRCFAFEIFDHPDFWYIFIYVLNEFFNQRLQNVWKNKHWKNVLNLPYFWGSNSIFSHILFSQKLAASRFPSGVRITSKFLMGIFFVADSISKNTSILFKPSFSIPDSALLILNKTKDKKLS